MSDSVNLGRAALMAAMAGLNPKIGIAAAELINELNNAGVKPERVEKLLQNFAGPLIEGAKASALAQYRAEQQAGKAAKKEPGDEL